MHLGGPVKVADPLPFGMLMSRLEVRIKEAGLVVLLIWPDLGLMRGVLGVQLI